MASRKGLGRGLGALLENSAGMEESLQPENPTELPVQKIEPNPMQPRKVYDETALAELAESIRANGIIQPLTVRKGQNGYYQIIAGERRWRAARLAGLQTVPVLVLQADDQKVMELALIENLQREDLNPVEEARGYETLIREYGLTQEEAAQRVGKSRSAVANALRLLSLPEEGQKLLESGELTPGHARAVLSLKSTEKQLQAIEQITAGQLSVRQAEALCRRLAAAGNPRPEPEESGKLHVDYLAACERELSEQLGRGVKIIRGRKKGRFELEFYGDEDLNTLLLLLQTIKPGRETTNVET